MVQLKGKPALDENLIRHMVFNNLRYNIRQFKDRYGEIVICCDAQSSWRKDYFPFYKAHRKKDREASKYDWNLIFNTIYKIKDEMKVVAPYRVVEVNNAEADDVIATLALSKPDENVLILSSDKDFIQLQTHKNISQYNQMMGCFVSSENPEQYLKEHILRGDRGDGIPNFLTADNALVVGERQKTITTAKLQVWVTQTPEEICTNDTMLRGYKRNETLIDLKNTPPNLVQQIWEAYEATANPPPLSKLMEYFVENKMTNMLEVLDEFR